MLELSSSSSRFLRLRLAGTGDEEELNVGGSLGGARFGLVHVVAATRGNGRVVI